MNEVKKNKKLYLFIFYIFLIIPYFSLPLLNNSIEEMGLIYNILKVVAFFILFFVFIIRNKLSKFNLSVFFFSFFVLLTTFLNHAAIKDALILVLNINYIMFLLEYGFRNENKLLFLKTFQIYLLFLIFINLILVIIYPDGMYFSNSISFITKHNWLFGFKNNHIIYILPGVMLTCILDIYKHNKLGIQSFLIIILSLISLSLVQSATGILAIFTFLILALILILNKDSKLFNVYNVAILYFAAFFGIVIFRLQNLFRYIIVDILKKDLTLTGRTYIWDYVINFIKQKPLIGYGIENINYRYYKTLYVRSFHAHNYLLEIIYKFGFIGFLLFGNIILTCFKEYMPYKNHLISKMILIAFTSFLMVTISEFYSIDILFFYLIFIYNVKYLIVDGDLHIRKDVK